jgi:hypothetical protein
MFGLNKSEQAIFRRLNTPIKIQDFLDTLPVNFEEKEETYLSPRRVLRERKAHCLEGALLAAAALWFQGEEPLLLDLKTTDDDQDHVVALYKKNGYWGAISKTNHACLRFRDPVYKTIRELVLSYFHEYFLNQTGEKTLVSYSRPFSLKRFGDAWITAEENLDEIAEALDFSRHFPVVPEKNKKFIRLASKLERKAGELVEFKTKENRQQL